MPTFRQTVERIVRDMLGEDIGLFLNDLRRIVSGGQVRGGTVVGSIQAPSFTATGLTGATAASRYVGATASGAPGSGTFAVGDYVVDQTGSIWVCTVAGTPGTWVEIGAAGGGSVVTTIVMGDASDPLTTGADKNPIPMEAPCALTITEVRLKVKTAPVGAAIIVDVNKNGTTIFTTQSNRPQIADGQTEGNTTTIEVNSLVKGDDLTFDIDQVGSSTAGSMLMVEVICTQAVA